MRHGTVVTLEDQISFASDRLVINPSLRHEAYASTFRRARREASCCRTKKTAISPARSAFDSRRPKALTV